jgi:alpha-tubulin suppressor-like RCC1 family protein
VAGGREHTLALVAGRVWAWGADLKGAVGDGGGFSASVSQPTQVTSTVSGVDSVTTGHYHSMALDKDADTVWAWGWNSRGQIGPAGGTSLKVAAPVRVSLPTGQVSMIAAGRAHSLAIVGGQVYAWGDNGSGQVGKTANTARNATPSLVQGLPAGVDWVAGGRDSSFAIADGKLYAWGNNAYGQLGDGTTTRRTSPVLIATGGAVGEVESGADHTIAVLSNGTVKSWGRNRYGQLGVSGSSNRLSPVSVPGLSGIAQVRVGRDHSMAFGGGDFYAWGRNDGGQLGVSATTVPQRSTPAAINGLAGVRDAGGGQVHTVVMR